MGDPRFERTVILIVEQGPDGTLGIVINNPIGEQPLASVFKALGQKDGDATGSVRVFSGGPVQPEVGFVVHSPDYRRPETVAITDRLSRTSSMAILRDIGDRRGPAKVLVAFGYAGWGCSPTGATSRPISSPAPKRWWPRLEDAHILIHEKKLSSLQLLPILEAAVQTAKPLLLVAEDIERRRHRSGGGAALLRAQAAVGKLKDQS